MKTWKLASPVAFGIGLCMVCAHVDAAATSRYVQDGLVAHWDGVENAGAGAPHDASASTWKDLVGGKEFSLTGVTVNADRMTFAGTQSSYGALSEADTTATFELAKTGTVEIVYASSSSADHQILLQSSTASGIAYGIYAKTTLIVCNASASRFYLTSGLATNCVALRYASAKPSSARANGKALSKRKGACNGLRQLLGRRGQEDHYRHAHLQGELPLPRIDLRDPRLQPPADRR